MPLSCKLLLQGKAKGQNPQILWSVTAWRTQPFKLTSPVFCPQWAWHSVRQVGSWNSVCCYRGNRQRHLGPNLDLLVPGDYYTVELPLDSKPLHCQETTNSHNCLCRTFIEATFCPLCSRRAFTELRCSWALGKRTKNHVALTASLAEKCREGGKKKSVFAK